MSKLILQKNRIFLDDGKATTVHVLKLDPKKVNSRLIHFDNPTLLNEWVKDSEAIAAVNGGFFESINTSHQGELWLNGEKIFDSISAFDRGCLEIKNDNSFVLNVRSGLNENPDNLLEAGPLLVKNRKSFVGDEGFSNEAHMFDSDITESRHPRTAIAKNSDTVWIIVAEGRSSKDVGLTLVELADFAIDLGATEALNLDGGSSCSLVYKERLINTPRTDEELLEFGPPIKTAIVFS